MSITLKKPFAPFMSIMAMWSMVVNKKWAIAQGDWNGTAATLSRLNNPKKPEDTPLFARANGTGPFTLAQWDRATRQVILERNEGYWRAPARLKRVIIRVVEDFGARRLMLQQGDADIITVGRPEQSAVEGLPGVRIVDDLSRLITDGVFMNLNVNIAGGNPDLGYADWGTLINLSRNWILGLPGHPFAFWYALIFPGGAIFLFVLGWNLLGDAFRDILDPRLRGSG